MYHMLPYAYREQPNCSRDQHGEFQNLVEDLVNKVSRETDLVDADNPNGRKLFNSMDSFFSYGLLTADRAYWHCIKTFLPRAEQKMLIAECGDANDRFLSIGWLKASFNKGTLHFMLLAMNNEVNKRWLPKHYHVNACLRNAGLLEKITEFIGRLQPVQFAFYSTRQMRPVVVPAAVVETATVQISSRQAARQRKITEKEESQEVVPNIVPEEIPPGIADNFSQGVVLDDLMRQRNYRMIDQSNAQNQAGTSQQNPGPSQPVIEEEKLEDVMTKKMSCVHLESMDPDGIDQILASVGPDDTNIPEIKVEDGEYHMSQGDILNLAINIFERSSEKIVECYQVLENFHTDAMQLRFLVVTNFNLYVFKHVQIPNGTAEMITSSEGMFMPLIRMPHDRIQTFRVSIDNLSFCVVATEKGFPYFVENNEQDDQSLFMYVAAMAGLESGARVVNTIINAVDHSAHKLPSRLLVDDHVGYMTFLQPNLEKELRRKFDVQASLLCMHYEQSEMEMIRSLGTKAGYLFRASVGTWMKNTADTQQNYCVAIGGEFLMFTDSTCKIEGSKRLKLCDTTFESKEPHFQLKGQEGIFEFECTSAMDFKEWCKILDMHTKNPTPTPYYASCLAIFTEHSIALVQEGERFWSDGFLRLLSQIDRRAISQAVIVHPPEDKESYFKTRSPALCLVTRDDTIHYIFIRYSKELDRVAAAVQSVYGVQVLKFSEEMLQTSVGMAINNVVCTANKIWPL
ncbi:hypothetical protein CAEBREN_14199 [Caenorhabditis brenneri]|uniref:RUN domain-containing protein n=1 Tax=Caenorhabditis brenneri TaxID=135651 RepID=G0MAZ2_CAEBE|nr:hypothetical protein CAEBREN_14199 [Caenorhabditis brenneri]